jgi:hypothetical protein
MPLRPIRLSAVCRRLSGVCPRKRPFGGKRGRGARAPKPVAPVVALNRAIAIAEVQGPAAALALVDELELDNYHAFHATRADLLRRLGRNTEAATASRARPTWHRPTPSGSSSGSVAEPRAEHATLDQGSLPLLPHCSTIDRTPSSEEQQARGGPACLSPALMLARASRTRSDRRSLAREAGRVRLPWAGHAIRLRPALAMGVPLGFLLRHGSHPRWAGTRRCGSRTKTATRGAPSGRLAPPQGRCASTFTIVPPGSSTKNRRTPQGSFVSG